jgi:hypothetical protein
MVTMPPLPPQRRLPRITTIMERESRKMGKWSVPLRFVFNLFRELPVSTWLCLAGFGVVSAAIHGAKMPRGCWDMISTFLCDSISA